VWKDFQEGSLVFLIAKRQEDKSHFSAYGIIRDKVIVEPDRWNNFQRQKLLAFSGHIVYPHAKIGHALLIVDINEVLHMMASLPRVLAQVERALKVRRGNLFKCC
jgi:hypothetical protein